MQELSLYFHVPYCRSRCFYCDFVTYTNKNGTMENYFKSICREIDMYKEFHGSKINTIFFGGGTPSLVDSAFIESVMNKCREVFDLSGLKEASIECNPESLTEEKLKHYKTVGINRLSIGLQAWQDRLLKRIGRAHNLEKFLAAYENARKTGFDNINFDLIFSLPDQSLEDWKETITNIVSLNPEHISSYSLKVEEGTRFKKEYDEGTLLIPDDEIDREMYYLLKDLLSKNGYHQYEISNFSKEGRECLHNVVYWIHKDYLGFGAGAHSFFNNKRTANVKTIEGYISSIEKNEFAYEEVEELSQNELMAEYIIVGLRLIEGVDKHKFENKFGKNIDEIYRDTISKFVKLGLLVQDKDNIKLTSKGLDLSNIVMREFLAG